MAQRLQEDGREVRIGGVTLRTPGLTGLVEVHEPAIAGGAGMRSIGAIEGAAPALLEALRNTSVSDQLTIEISGAQEVEGAGVRPVRRDSAGQEMIEVEVPAAGDEFGQFILATDESGFVSWHLPKTEMNAIDTTRGAVKRTFLIPRRVRPETGPASAGTRGLMGVIGKKILKVLIFPLIDPLIGSVGELFASKWEKRNRPYGIRTFTPANYRQPVGEAVIGEGWEALAAGPALLFVHGTFSRAHSAFGGLDLETLQTLYDRYQGRVFAFEHPTLSEDPSQNVQWLVGQIPAATRLKLDVVCHSRGGLVTRELARGGMPHVAVRRIVFAGTPNAGTLLTDAQHMGDFIDTYTNLLQWFPDNGVTEVLEAVITVLKQLAVGVLQGLDGLQSMLPGGPYLTHLPRAIAGAELYALASDFEPQPGSPVALRTADVVVDRVFGAGVANDLVVPTGGVYEWDPAAFPAPRLHVFQGTGAPVHTRYFTEPMTQQLLLGWLT